MRQVDALREDPVALRFDGMDTARHPRTSVIASTGRHAGPTHLVPHPVPHPVPHSGTMPVLRDNSRPFRCFFVTLGANPLSANGFEPSGTNSHQNDGWFMTGNPSV